MSLAELYRVFEPYEKKIIAEYDYGMYDSTLLYCEFFDVLINEIEYDDLTEKRYKQVIFKVIDDVIYIDFISYENTIVSISFNK